MLCAKTMRLVGFARVPRMLLAPRIVDVNLGKTGKYAMGGVALWWLWGIFVPFG